MIKQMKFVKVVKLKWSYMHKRADIAFKMNVVVHQEFYFWYLLYYTFLSRFLGIFNYLCILIYKVNW